MIGSGDKSIFFLKWSGQLGITSCLDKKVDITNFFLYLLKYHEDNGL